VRDPINQSVPSITQVFVVPQLQGLRKWPNHVSWIGLRVAFPLVIPGIHYRDSLSRGSQPRDPCQKPQGGRRGKLRLFSTHSLLISSEITMEPHLHHNKYRPLPLHVIEPDQGMHHRIATRLLQWCDASTIFTESENSPWNTKVSGKFVANQCSSK